MFKAKINRRTEVSALGKWLGRKRLSIMRKGSTWELASLKSRGTYFRTDSN